MFTLTALYDQPSDKEGFDQHYREVHAVLASKLPGLKRYSLSHPVPGPDGATPKYHLVAVLEWDSAEEFAAGMGGPEGQAAVEDLPNLARFGGTATLLTGSGELVGQ